MRASSVVNSSLRPSAKMTSFLSLPIARSGSTTRVGGGATAGFAGLVHRQSKVPMATTTRVAASSQSAGDADQRRGFAGTEGAAAVGASPTRSPAPAAAGDTTDGSPGSDAAADGGAD